MRTVDEIKRLARIGKQIREEVDRQRSLALHELDVRLGIPARFNEHGQLVVTQRQWYAMRREFMSPTPPTWGESLVGIDVVVEDAEPSDPDPGG